MNSKIILRKAELSDVSQITKLFYETIQHVNIKDYTKDEVDDWSSWHTAHDRWEEKMLQQYFVVAFMGEEMVGFTSIDKKGYLDFMFVHKDHQGEGIASQLLQAMEEKANEQGNDSVWSEVSLTAKGFFERKGYVVEQEQLRRAREMELVNFIMRKPLR